MRADVVIVAHNPGALLAAAVKSAMTQDGAGQVWVLDAESTDGSADPWRAAAWQEEPVDANGPHVLDIPNRGFAASCNRGISATEAPFVLLLNPDAELLPGSLGALLATAQAHPRAGIVGALVLDPRGSVQGDSFGRFPSLRNTIVLKLRAAWHALSGDPARAPQLPVTGPEVDWVTGAAMLARREAIDDVGLLDEGFFLYYEDVDWCWRMRDAGWEVLLEPAARVVHHLGGSAVPRDMVTRAYRDSFYRYCDQRGLWGLKMAARAGLALRGRLGGWS